MKKRILCLTLFLICMTTVISVSASRNIVSQNASYTLLTPASDGYADNGEKLTDGRKGIPVPTGEKNYYYRSDAYVGFNKASVNEDGNYLIRIDLGERKTNLTGFEVSYLNETDVGIFAPVEVTFSVADEIDGTYTQVGSQTVDLPTDPGRSETGNVVLTLSEGVSGRYVLCSVRPRDTFTAADGTQKTATWTFLDEISVLQGKPAGSETSDPTPPTGDNGVMTFVLMLGVSGIATGALLKKKTTIE